MTEPFAVFDCSLARMPIGRSCSNLRELLEAIRTVPDMVIEHHMTRCALADHFDLDEFPNDLARWCWDMLGDHMLAEQLGLIDPYQHEIDRFATGRSGQCHRRAGVGDRPRAVVPARLGTAPGRFAAGRLRHGRTTCHARRVGRGDTSLLAPVFLLSRAHCSAAHTGPFGRFLQLARVLRCRCRTCRAIAENRRPIHEPEPGAGSGHRRVSRMSSRPTTDVEGELVDRPRERESGFA